MDPVVLAKEEELRELVDLLVLGEPALWASRRAGLVVLRSEHPWRVLTRAARHSAMEIHMKHSAVTLYWWLQV